MKTETEKLKAMIEAQRTELQRLSGVYEDLENWKIVCLELNGQLNVIKSKWWYKLLRKT